MSETRSRRSGGRAARQAARLHAHVERVPFLTRTLAPVEVLSEEGLATIEANAERILQEVGIEFHDAPDALDLFTGAGAAVDGERVRFPAGLCRSLVQASAPERFTQVVTLSEVAVYHIPVGGPQELVRRIEGTLSDGTTAVATPISRQEFDLVTKAAAFSESR